jgi:hypothetical protein
MSQHMSALDRYRNGSFSDNDKSIDHAEEDNHYSQGYGDAYNNDDMHYNYNDDDRYYSQPIDDNYRHVR